MDKYNEMIRKEVDQHITDLQIKKGFSEKEAIKNYMEELYQKFDNVSSVIKDPYSLYKNMFIGVIFTDAYKLYSYKTKVHLMTDLEKDVFFQLYNFEDMSDLFSEISANPSLFADMLHATYSFYNMDKMGQKMVLSSLAPSENEYLTKIFNPHQYDLLKKDEPLSIESIVSSFITKQEYMDHIIDISFDDEIIWEMVGYLKYVSINRKDEVGTFYKKLMITDYKVICKVLKEVEDEDMQSRLKFYSDNDVQTIINKLGMDQDLLFNILKNYIDLVINLKMPEIDLDTLDELDMKDDAILKKLLKV